MYKVVVNGCFGGYGVSEKGAAWLLANGASPEKVAVREYPGGDCSVTVYLERHDPLLVRMVEELGERASGPYARLCVHTMEQPLYRIDEYDGCESVEEPGHVHWIDAREGQEAR
jgi:hypothetical protein